MAIITKKLSDLSKRKITKSDSTIEEVNISDVTGNVISSGTQITDSVLSNINYKDDNSISFNISNFDITPLSGKSVVYTKNDGNFYFKTYNKPTIDLSSNGIEYESTIKKFGTNYTINGEMKYFNLQNGSNFFSTRTKIGSIPSRISETDNISDSTYLDFKLDEIKGYIEGNNKFLISNNRFEFDINNTKVGINPNLDKFNCYTNLSNAVYGNNKFKIDLDNYYKIKNNLGTELVKISDTGVINLNKFEVYTQNSHIKEENETFKINTTLNGLNISNSSFSIDMNNLSIKIKNNSNQDVFEIKQNGDVYLGDTNIKNLLLKQNLGISHGYLNFNNRKIDCELYGNRIYQMEVLEGNYSYYVKLTSDEVENKHFTLYSNVYFMVKYYEGNPDYDEDYSYFYVRKYNSSSSYQDLIIENFIEYYGE